MAQAAALPAGHMDAPIPTRRVIAFFAMVVGMFMAILDIQIVSASLAEIQAGLSASTEEIAWVQTSYLIAEVVMIPLSGFLGRVFSTRWVFAFSAAGFTLMSVACGLSTSIEEMILFRALQGFIGGGMIPSVFAASFSIFPPSKRGVVTPLIGLVATLAPTIGPTIGGYLTDLMSWHWLFFINIIPGVIVALTTASLIDFDRPNLKLLDHFDWWGLLFMAMFLGGTEYVLEEGPLKDWFDEDLVTIFTVIAVGGGIAFFTRMFTAKQPIVDLHAFRNPNFAMGCLFSFVMGIGLYGLTYMYPLYLGRVRHYSSLQIGETMFLSGLCMFLTAPIAGRLATKLDPRYMLAVGFAGFAVGTYIATGVTKDWDFYELLWPQILRGVSLMICMIPISNLALGMLPPEQIKNASGLYNLMRNLGGAVGLAAINTLMNSRFDLHLARLHEQVDASSVAAHQWLDTLAQRFAGGTDPQMMALKQLTSMVRAEAYVMSFGDAFLALTVLCAGLVPVVLMVRKPQARAGGGGGH
jgi:DHA2 family multidrug resistance protein